MRKKEKTRYDKAREFIKTQEDVECLKKISKAMKDFIKYSPAFKISNGYKEFKLKTGKVSLTFNGVLSTGLNHINCLSEQDLFEHRHMRIIFFELVKHLKKESKEKEEIK